MIYCYGIPERLFQAHWQEASLASTSPKSIAWIGMVHLHRFTSKKKILRCLPDWSSSVSKIADRLYQELAVLHRDEVLGPRTSRAS